MGYLRLKESQKQLIEKAGVFFEQGGISPASARILALLLISDETSLTFDEIYQNLGISKSSASTAINFLIKTKKIEYITKPGDRKRYFRSTIATWLNDFEQRFAYMEQIGGLFKEIHKQRTKETKEFNKMLEDFMLFMEFMRSEFPLLIEKWKKKQKTNK